MNNVLLVPQLSNALTRKDLSQKYIAYDSGTPQSTLSEHITGKQPVKLNKIIDYANSLNDSRFNLECRTYSLARLRR